MQTFSVKEWIKELVDGFGKNLLPSNPRPSLYYVHPSEQLFIKDFRHDVTASDAPITGTGQYIIANFKVEKSQVLIVKGFAPYAMERTNVGAAGLTESARFITPQDGNGWFVFEPRVNLGQPALIETDFNAPQNMAGATKSDLSFRQKSNGISQISLTPREDAERSFLSPFFGFKVGSGQTFQCIFSLSGPAAPTDAINNPYAIGDPTAPATKRVDFAGVYLTGVVLPERAYQETGSRFGEEG